MIAIGLAGLLVITSTGAASASSIYLKPARHFDQGAACMRSWNQVNVNPPQIYAINRTSGIDAQVVRWRPVLARWTGTKWATYRAKKFSAPALAWDYESMGGLGSPQFAPMTFSNVPAGRFYRVAIQYQWLALRNGVAVVEAKDYRWVQVHKAMDGAIDLLQNNYYCKLT